jgi:hypothetical protein
VIANGVQNKRVLMERNAIKSFIKHVLLSLDKEQRENFDHKLRLKATECLISLGGIYNRKLYIPGETRDNDQARKNLIEGGGMMCLIYVANQTEENEIKSVINEFIDNLEIKDLQY